MCLRKLTLRSNLSSHLTLVILRLLANGLLFWVSTPSVIEIMLVLSFILNKVMYVKCLAHKKLSIMGLMLFSNSRWELMWVLLLFCSESSIQPVEIIVTTYLWNIQSTNSVPGALPDTGHPAVGETQSLLTGQPQRAKSRQVWAGQALDKVRVPLQGTDTSLRRPNRQSSGIKQSFEII